jgi:hypothetical protein
VARLKVAPPPPRRLCEESRGKSRDRTPTTDHTKDQTGVARMEADSLLFHFQRILAMFFLSNSSPTAERIRG